MDHLQLWIIKENQIVGINTTYYKYLTIKRKWNSFDKRSVINLDTQIQIYENLPPDIGDKIDNL